MTEDRLLNDAEVAALLGVKASWVADHAREGHIAHVKLGRYRRYRRDDVDEFVEACRTGAVRTRGRLRAV